MTPSTQAARVALALCCLGGCAPREAPRVLTDADVTALRAIAEKDASIALAKDWATLVAEYTPDAVRMPPSAPPIQGRDAIRKMLEGMPPISAFNFRPIDLQGDGTLAYMRAAWHSTANPPGMTPVSDSGKILIVLASRRTDRGCAWQMLGIRISRRSSAVL